MANPAATIQTSVNMVAEAMSLKLLATFRYELKPLEYSLLLFKVSMSRSSIDKVRPST